MDAFQLSAVFKDVLPSKGNCGIVGEWVIDFHPNRIACSNIYNSVYITVNIDTSRRDDDGRLLFTIDGLPAKDKEYLIGVIRQSLEGL